MISGFVGPRPPFGMVTMERDSVGANPNGIQPCATKLSVSNTLQALGQMFHVNSGICLWGVNPNCHSADILLAQVGINNQLKAHL